MKAKRPAILTVMSICLIMMISALSITAIAAEEPTYAASIGESKYASLNEAITAAKAGDTVTLLRDVEVTSTIQIVKELTLDLNGYTVSGSGMQSLITIYGDSYNGDLTVTDTSAAQNGAIVHKGNYSSATVAVWAYAGPFTMNAGTIKAEATDARAFYVQNAHAQINGGTIDGNLAVFATIGSSLEMNGGTVIGGKEGIQATKAADVTVSGGRITGVSALTVHKNANVSVCGSAELVGVDHGIAGNGTVGDSGDLGTVVTVKDNAAISATVGIYHPQFGVLNIEGGTVTGSDTGIEIRAGELNISGGNIISTADTFSFNANGNGSTTVGAALSVSQHTTEQSIAVQISSGSFSGIKALYEDDAQNAPESENTAIAVSGGSFNGEVISANAKLTVSGGSFTSDPSAYTDDLHVAEKLGELYNISDLSLDNAAAKIGDVPYKTLKLALDAANGATVVLLKDIEAMPSYDIIGKSVVIDLNGHSITAEDRSWIFRVAFGATLELKGDGTLKENTYYYSPIIYKASEPQSHIIVGENVTLEGWSGIMIDKNVTNAASLKVDLYGTAIGRTDVSGGLGSGIYINGSIASTSVYPIINIHPGATVSATEGVGIYAAGYAEWNVEGTVTGMTGIAIKAGMLNIGGNAVISGTGEADIPTEGYSNGINISGAAIQIESNNSYAGNIIVKISGTPEIKSTNAYAVYEYINKTDSSKLKSVTITGGTFTSSDGLEAIIFTSDATSAKKITVSGGTFSSDPTSFLMFGYEATGSGPYTVTKLEATESDTTVGGLVVGSGGLQEAVEEFIKNNENTGESVEVKVPVLTDSSDAAITDQIAAILGATSGTDAKVELSVPVSTKDQTTVTVTFNTGAINNIGLAAEGNKDVVLTIKDLTGDPISKPVAVADSASVYQLDLKIDGSEAAFGNGTGTATVAIPNTLDSEYVDLWYSNDGGATWVRFSGEKTVTATEISFVTDHFSVWAASLAIVDKPTADNTVFTYNGMEQTYDIPANDAYTVVGNKQTYAGTYNVTVTLKDGYQWSDGTTDDLIFTFKLNHTGNLEFRRNETHIQWRYTGEPKWKNVMAIADITGSDGQNGREVEFRTTETHVQWKYTVEDDSAWRNIIAFDDIKGEDGEDGTNGREVEFRTTETHIQWKYTNEDDSAWRNVIALEDIKGEDGSNGTDGTNGTNGTNGSNGTNGRELELRTEGGYIQWRYVGESVWKDLISLDSLKGDKGEGGDKGDTGAAGADGKDGHDGINGVDGLDGYNGRNADNTAVIVCIILSSVAILACAACFVLTLLKKKLI